MPLPRITCPECGAGLKSATGFKVGQTVACPKCETDFEVEEPDDAPAKAKKPVRAAARDDDDDDDDRPRKKKKKRRDDEKSYKNSPLRFVILGVLVVVMGVLGFLLLQKRKGNEVADTKPNPDGDTAPVVNPGGPGRPAGPRQAVENSRSQNRMKIIGLAVHNYLDANDKFPEDIKDAAGKPILSWRVALLPYLEQQPLFQQFKLNEAWDSPANQMASKSTVAGYSAGTPQTGPGGYGMADFVGVSGPGTVLRPEG